uniref:UPF0449 protein C19orf25 homolog n=1 Tax=Ciona intestinalis TaxID=7719 RepID=H2XJS5_CIOIN|nr:UPF0449 protein C19orf25 homolog isoform X1 [Ciona intestinalis]|eukprot:XP_002129291.1 UPF0449 protein C19orf25 homolog isoform X1 [Ciona intestinalis]
MLRKNDVKQLAVRPPPPTLEEIIEDVTNAKDDDFAFVSMADDVTEEEFIDAKEDSDENVEIMKIEERYNEVTKFLSTNEELSEGSSDLRKLFEQISTRGQILRQKINELKSMKQINEDNAL